MFKSNLIKLIVLSTACSIINDLSEHSEFLKMDDHNFKKTICVPTYGSWGTVEGCSEKANVSPYDEPKVCWIYQGSPIKKYKRCQIIFEKPIKTHIILNVLSGLTILKIIDIFFGGFIFVTIQLIGEILFNFPIILYVEIYFHLKKESTFSIYRIIQYALMISKEVYKKNGLL